MLFFIIFIVAGIKDMPAGYESQEKLFELSIRDLIKLVDLEGEIKRDIDKPGIVEDRKMYLNKAINDVYKLKSIKKEDLEKIKNNSELIYKIMYETKGGTMKRDDYLKIEESRSNIIKIMGQGSFSDLILTTNKMASFLQGFRKVDNSNEIKNEIMRLENNGWKNSPYLNRLQSILCCNYMEINNDEKLLVELEKLKKMDRTILEIFDERNMVVKLMEMHLCYKEKKYNDVLLIFNRIPNEWKETTRIARLITMRSVYEYTAKSYWNIGKKKEAIAYQEMSTSMFFELRDGQEAKEIQKGAYVLRDMYAETGEWTALRNLEERFKLLPLPKNPAEK